jgi:hypothetical protein
MCQEISDADEEKVNKQLEKFRPLGTWTPWNQCQTFASDVLDNAGRKNGANDNHATNPYWRPWVPRSSI